MPSATRAIPMYKRGFWSVIGGVTIRDFYSYATWYTTQSALFKKALALTAKVYAESVPIFNRENLVLNKLTSADDQFEKTKTMFAKFGDGHWYAILPSMEEAFLKAGAHVSTLTVDTVCKEPEN